LLSRLTRIARTNKW
jgi:hypothetical protein